MGQKTNLNSEQIRKQSEAAYGQWCEQWRRHATHHSKYEMKPLENMRFSGVGRPILLVANGYSLEQNIETVKEYSGKVDIMCCDKTLGHLLDNDIIVNYCMVCDANVDYEKYMEKYKDRLENTTLFINVCANPKWTDNGNWKDRYFFVNKDILKSEKEFCELSGCGNVIPASTNVSNAMVVFMTQSDERGRQNFFGYDKMVLIGFDYSWLLTGHYYAFNKSGDGKMNYMRHMLGYDANGKLGCTSQNLLFSAKWLKDYITVFNLPVIQCSQEAVTGIEKTGDLAEQLDYEFRTDDSEKAKMLIKTVAEASNTLKRTKKMLTSLFENHENNMLKTA
ncbi:MAG: DUF115 domain-containing protein [Arenibacter sp.]|nr:DUF115 domain-containing protein [Arenibacter sp.]